jgi:3-oxoadipate enol-lactonase
MIPNHRFDGVEDGPVLVLSNSLGTTMDMWEPQLPAFSQRFRVLRYDTRGHGGSPVPPGPYTIDEIGGDVLELLDSLGLERISFCGLSLGGAVGIWLAANAPARLDRLVLCCTAAQFPPPELWEERAAAARRDGVEALADAVMQRWFSAGFRAAHPETVARFRALVASTPAEGYAACCEALRDLDLRPRLGEVAAPTLVVAGSEDPATPPERGQLIADGIPGARLVVIEGVAHLANLERPGELDATVLDHLDAA